MRPIYLFISLLIILALTACGSEEVLTPPLYSNVVASGSLGSTTILTASSQDDTVTISGIISDFSATIIAITADFVEVPVAVNSTDGSWSYQFVPLEGANPLTLAASDLRGNINQLILNVQHDTTAPQVSSVTQNFDDPLAPKLIVTFNEAILDSSVTANPFVVDAIPLTGAAILDTDLTSMVVTVPLNDALALPPGEHQLTCTGVTDLSTPGGNSIAADYIFTFTIE